MPYYYVAASPRTVSLAGGSATIQLQVVAFGDVGNVTWSIDAAPSTLTITPATGTNRAGDVVSVTLSTTSAPAAALAVFHGP